MEKDIDNTQRSNNIMGTPGSTAQEIFKRRLKEAVAESVPLMKSNDKNYDRNFINELKSIISKYTEAPELLNDIESDTNESFIEKLNIDSVDFVEIIVDAEEKFGITLEDEKIKSVKNFDDLYYLIYNKVQEKEKTE
ncbi:MAG: acyl carrier protein [Chitinophagaceae bacterium]|jgi:acyl carrier protein|nr:acyl carrier protein [Chitinophagaceae bacterium]